jgi:hypothetical protein
MVAPFKLFGVGVEAVGWFAKGVERRVGNGVGERAVGEV